MIHLIANPTMCAMGGWCWVCMSGDCGFNAISKQFCPLYTTTSSFILQYMLLVCSRSSSFKSQDICRVLCLIHDIKLAKALKSKTSRKCQFYKSRYRWHFVRKFDAAQKHMPKTYAKSLSWPENIMGRKFKFSAQDSDLTYCFEPHPTFWQRLPLSSIVKWFATFKLIRCKKYLHQFCFFLIFQIGHFQVPYTRHYNLWLVYFKSTFWRS